MLLKGCNEDNTSGFFGLFNRKFHTLTDHYTTNRRAASRVH